MMVQLPFHLMRLVSRSKTPTQLLTRICSDTKEHLASSNLRFRQFSNTKLAQSAEGGQPCTLASRAVLRLSGADTSSLLQGLVTNDVEQLMSTAPSVQYCMMLNVQGRVLYDLFLYNMPRTDSSAPTLLMDVDVSVKEELIKSLRRYRLRKKVDISDVSDEFMVQAHWAGYNDTPLPPLSQAPHTLSFEDPRVPTLGHRVISPTKTDQEKSSAEIEKAYRLHRYQWGVPEGVQDLPPGGCLPLESNLALMNGVNFQKGCYIGQELTARTYHTGVTRKRILPVILDRSADVALDTPIKTEKGRNAGKFRSAEGCLGLGLLRLAHLKDKISLTDKDGQAISLSTAVPTWWPDSVLEAKKS